MDPSAARSELSGDGDRPAAPVPIDSRSGENELAPASVLAPFLIDQGLIPDGAALSVAEIGNGHSNLTFLLQAGDPGADGTRVVLRRPPRPPYAESAHDVLREARVLAGLAGHGVALPAILATGEDPALIGVPFVIMEFVDGVCIDEELPAEIDAAGAAAISAELVSTLVALHAVDPALAGLGEPERADGYLARQIRRFGSIWEAQRTRELEDMDVVVAWLAAHLPVTQRRVVVHGDYRLGNTLFSLNGAAGPGTDRPPVLSAVLDWEMTALGDPLADLGYLLASWAEPEDEDNPILRLSGATRQPGFWTREQIRAAYEQASGLSTQEIAFYEVLAAWKSTIFLEASYRRFREGRASDPYFAELEDGIPRLAAAARARIPA